MIETKEAKTSRQLLEFAEILSAATPEQKEAFNAFIDNLVRIREERARKEAGI